MNKSFKNKKVLSFFPISETKIKSIERKTAFQKYIILNKFYIFKKYICKNSVLTFFFFYVQNKKDNSYLFFSFQSSRRKKHTELISTHLLFLTTSSIDLVSSAFSQFFFTESLKMLYSPTSQQQNKKN